MLKIGEQIKVYSKIVQALFLGVLLLGFSMMVGEFIGVTEYHSIFSELSVQITTYGALGMVACEYAARRFGNIEIEDDSDVQKEAPKE